MQMVNLNDPLNRWTLDTVKMVCDKVKGYVLRRNISDVELLSVEDNTWADSDNQRYDVTIRYTSENGYFMEQKLLILKGEVLDGVEFHKRYNEFYGKKEG